MDVIPPGMETGEIDSLRLWRPGRQVPPWKTVAE